MSKKNKKQYLICSDLDGTLLNSKSQITNYTKKVVKEISKTNIFCIFTARPIRSSINFYKQLGLTSIIVNYNGALIHKPFDKNFKKISFSISRQTNHKIFNNKTIRNIIDYAIFESNEKIYIFNDNWKINKNTKKNLIFMKTNNWLKKFNIFLPAKTYFFNDIKNINFDTHTILIKLKKSKFYKVLKQKILSLSNDLYIRIWKEKNVGSLVEINAISISKGSALKYVANFYKIPFKNCYAFGDNENDILMLKYAKRSFAMKNGLEKAKQKACNITQWTNDEDGVARTLNKIFKLGFNYHKK